MRGLAIENIGQWVQPSLDGEGLTPLTVQANVTVHVDGQGRVEGIFADGAAPPVPTGYARLDLDGRAVVPGFVDSHTHTVFAGSRADEMARRARGESYEEIAAAGGGIVVSVQALKDSSVDKLVALGLERVRRMVAKGVTTLEIKSGYGLEPKLEMKQLQAMLKLVQQSPIPLVLTALAHLVPKHLNGKDAKVRADHLQAWIEEFLKPAAAHDAVRYCDIFIEAGAFTTTDAEVLIEAARSLGLRVKLHVDQLRDGGGAAFAASQGVLSADHLEFTSEAGAKALAEAGTVATILPGCKLFLGKGPWPPARMLKDAGCKVAIATDYNPGSSRVNDLALCGTMAATLCGLSLEEALWGMTRGGALALGFDDRGTLIAGSRADMLVLDSGDWRDVLYRPTDIPVWAVYVAGKEILPRPTQY